MTRNIQAVDYLILGGGSAGCVLAARLSEDPSKTVLLIEAGRDITRDSMPKDIRARYPGLAYLDRANIWPTLEARISGAPNTKGKQAPRLYEQGRVLGGGSAINAMVANRGALDDYDEWGRIGAEGWDGETALRYFRKLERDVDFDNEYHGKDGPIPVRRLPANKVSRFVQAVKRTLVAQGYPARDDQNGLWEDGVFPACITVSDDGHRVPASVGYLTDEVRARSNLTIQTGTHALKLTFDGKRVTGAVVARDGEDPCPIPAGETLVTMGGIHSCALLLRSGIGPAEELQSLGICSRHDLAGVGKNLMEHPLIAVSTYLPPALRMQDLEEHHDQALLRYTSSISDAEAGDMHCAILGRTAWHGIGQRLGTILVWVNKAFSRGEVRLRSADPRVEPEVDFRLLSDPRDMERLKEGFRLAAKILSNPDLKQVCGPVFPTSYSERVKRVSAPGPWNAFQLRLFSKMLDWAGPLRNLLIHTVVTMGISLRKLLADDRGLEEFIGNSVSGVWHASGTCRMGAPDDPMAVTDGGGRVLGLDGLRVCDSSIMPSIPRANTNLPTMMLAERLADVIKANADAGLSGT
ncbi:5-(hydroxymethyl)furfural/furfural oxidase [Paracoccus pantotrophus]|nr:5-(hydroxymethyl)furfural/furfural oxidase [Paracoccus pantotrophus]